MSIDFDSAALQTQQEEEEEYDQEDYAREQEVRYCFSYRDMSPGTHEGNSFINTHKSRPGS